MLAESLIKLYYGMFFGRMIQNIGFFNQAQQEIQPFYIRVVIHFVQSPREIQQTYTEVLHMKL